MKAYYKPNYFTDEKIDELLCILTELKLQRDVNAKLFNSCTKQIN